MLDSFNDSVQAAPGEWTTLPSMFHQRSRPTVTLVSSGYVLVTGGVCANLTELYEPVSRTWSPAAPLAEARFEHTATVLQDGRVLIVGGQQQPCGGSTYLVSGQRRIV
jgi:hypothetical protein